MACSVRGGHNEAVICLGRRGKKKAIITAELDVQLDQPGSLVAEFAS
jgi:hypothetical protein